MRLAGPDSALCQARSGPVVGAPGPPPLLRGLPSTPVAALTGRLFVKGELKFHSKAFSFLKEDSALKLSPGAIH